MAKALAICKYAILLALITNLHILLTEGRKIKSMNFSQKEMANHGSKSINLHQTGTVEGSTSEPAPPSDHISGSSGAGKSPAGKPDDFRPTPLGHSPGVDHSLLSGVDRVADSKASSADNSNCTHSAVGSGDDYRPIHTGIHGIGYPPSEESEGTESKFSAACKDDFHPTSPGCSPGIGHLLSEDSEKTGPKVPAGFTRKHSVAGLTDDFRPTQPGHSPRVGHVSKTKNAKN